jgi:hypothetical protein
MPIANYTDYLKAVNNPCYKTQIAKGSMVAAAGRIYSLWAWGNLAGAFPSAPGAPTDATIGALPFVNSADVQRIAQVEATLGNPGMIIICDRLSHQGGLSGTVITEQTTNLPTAALTRYTDGVGVMAALEIYTAVGTTVTTVSANYTNHLGISGQITPLTVFGGTAFREVQRFIILPLADGDLGVQSIASVTLTASTGTAGNFGVTLFKPLFAFPILMPGQQMLFDSILGMCGNMPRVLNNACLFVLIVPQITSTGEHLANVNIVKE